jgi:hypothetical protein
LIGAPLADTIPLGADTGEEQAYVFNRTSSGWPQNEDQVLRPSSEASDFGSSVAIDGKHAIVGAPGTGNTPADNQMAFAYELTATESRKIRDEDQILRPSNAEKGDLFSSAVAIDGEDAFVGASSEDGSANGKSDAGATYLFQRTSSGWPTNEAKILRASNAEGNDTFGRDIATDKGRLLIGASGADGPSNNKSGAGAVYLFEQTSSGWAKNEHQIFRATNAESGDFFGHSVAVGKGRAIIGAVGEDGPSNNMESGGAAYVFDLFSSLTLRDGSSDQLDFSADVSPGTSDNPMGILSLKAEKSGAAVEGFTVTNSSPGTEGISAARLYWSTDQVLDPATDAKLDELSTDASSAPMTFGFDGFTQSIPTSTGYLIVAIDVEASASTSEVQFSIDQPSDLSTPSGRIKTVNGSDQTDFSGLPLSNGSTALPVEITSFEGVATNGDVRLQWKTASETNNAGFSVLRRKEKTGAWTEIGSVDGGGTTDQPQTYRFVDANVPYTADSVSYRLRQVDIDGTVSLTDPLVIGRSGPTGLQLRDTAPNPARQQVNIRYGVPEETKGEVRLRLYDVLGRQVRSVKLQVKSGRHRETLDVSGLSSGMYVLHLQTGSGQAVTRKLTVVR